MKSRFEPFFQRRLIGARPAAFVAEVNKDYVSTY